MYSVNFALCSLQQQQNPCALVIESVKQMEEVIIQKKLNEINYMNIIISQRTGVRYKADQNTLESVLFDSSFSSCFFASRSPDQAAAFKAYLDSSDSQIHFSLPKSSISVYHLKFTSNLPVTFFTVQKSNAAKSTITTKTMISSPIIAFRNRKLAKEAILKPTWNMQATGFLAVANTPVRLSINVVYDELN